MRWLPAAALVIVLAGCPSPVKPPDAPSSKTVKAPFQAAPGSPGKPGTANATSNACALPPGNIRVKLTTPAGKPVVADVAIKPESDPGLPGVVIHTPTPDEGAGNAAPGCPDDAKLPTTASGRTDAFGTWDSGPLADGRYQITYGVDGHTGSADGLYVHRQTGTFDFGMQVTPDAGATGTAAPPFN